MAVLSDGFDDPDVPMDKKMGVAIKVLKLMGEFEGHQPLAKDDHFGRVIASTEWIFNPALEPAECEKVEASNAEQD